ncbi:MAG TPA: hypothetical protein PLL30_03250 [Candidatus Krumholzibacteria bacterium]|nr:hypothetical protein [Candidatus Krumholzibacteria bacterium]HPD70789.1 hypothetical protein [Candidatus Krumholzibacteria bacterium]HRY39511.1 hypothetical protein [Candidatus Krumholzibacteria bacterium]
MSATPGQAACDLQSVADAVWRRCRDADFAGSDPYDGLKSRLLAPLFDRSRLLRLAVIQGVKRSPIDLRPLLRIPRGRNPKALALLLLAGGALPRLVPAADRRRLADLLAGQASLPDGSPVFADRPAQPGQADRLIAAAPAAAGWGYDFPWQARAFEQPAHYPTVVCTSFVVDAFASVGHPAAGAVTRAAAGLVADYLHRGEDTTGVWYSYSPRDRTRVFNASLFAGKILARSAVTAIPDESARLRGEAIRVVDYVAARQRPDGSWFYGEADHWQWIDNFHTGFVLETIAGIAELIGEPARWDDTLARGLTYYRQHCFASDLTPYYYADRPLRLDSHTVAQSALTFLALARFDPALDAAARRVLEIGVARLYDPARRGFVHQRSRWLSHRAIHLRWSQAWMLRALATCLAHEEHSA